MSKAKAFHRALFVALLGLVLVAPAMNSKASLVDNQSPVTIVNGTGSGGNNGGV